MSERYVATLEGEARIRKLNIPIMRLDITPEDLNSPLSFQILMEKIMESVTKTLEEEPHPQYMAEVSIRDSLGMPVRFVVNLGDKVPYFSKDKVKVRLILEFYEEEDLER
ncbi:hypothetical protein EYM_03335 [Ignicoccus islandicus DSM 13165]|uniref:Arcadin 1 domain-containing protein n=1 Tax=Ignicoccus islandicus DSM 13165 TaxID=940295 RepID=A0A0U3E8G0_9CREN|nr:hypothetical protein [Ignicoccus islandicus]ALU11646.1 hypothetical protein EYM_03335 [Ignicoccus islandicus DSM 13165]